MTADREAARQQALLNTLWQRPAAAEAGAWFADDAARQAAGLGVYRANGHALAARALAAAFPTVCELVGDEAFAGLARAFWHADLPRRGDIAHWGSGLPAFIAADPQLADLPYLADVARVDWAVHGIEAAADAPPLPAGLQRLASDDPAELCFDFRDGLQLIDSRWPVVTLWQAHRTAGDAGDDRFAAARLALAARRAEAALVWRDGFRGAVDALAPADRLFTGQLAGGTSLGAALAQAGEGFDFQAWLARALQQRWLLRVRRSQAAPRA